MMKNQIITEAQKRPKTALKENSADMPVLCNKNAHAALVAAPVPKGGRPMTDKQKQSIRDMRQQGMSYRTIAAALGFSANTVKSFCRRTNIDILSYPNDEKQNLCKNCGAILKHHPKAKKKTFCGDRCRYAWWNKNRVRTAGKGAYRLTCFHCGAEFYSQNKKRKYCGRDCYINCRFGEGLP